MTKTNSKNYQFRFKTLRIMQQLAEFLWVFTISSLWLLPPPQRESNLLLFSLFLDSLRIQIWKTKPKPTNGCTISNFTKQNYEYEYYYPATATPIFYFPFQFSRQWFSSIHPAFIQTRTGLAGFLAGFWLAFGFLAGFWLTGLAGFFQEQVWLAFSWPFYGILSSSNLDSHF